MEKITIPGTDDGLLYWAQNFVKFLKANTTLLKLDPKKIAHIDGLTTKYTAAMEKVRAPNHTRNDNTVKKNLAPALRKECRVMLRTDIQYNPGMTPELWVALTPNIKLVTRKINRPESKPGLRFELEVGRVTVRYFDGRSGKRGKPKGVRGLKYSYVITSEPVKSYEELRLTNSITSGPFIIDVSESQRGKLLSIAAQWENTRGEPGQFSDIIEIYIP